MNLRQCLLTVGLCAVVGVAPAVSLISPQEMQASIAATEPFTAKASPVPGAPVIEVIAPRMNAPITSPSSIELLFQSVAPSAVRPETFRVLYGRLRLDITHRLLSATTITAHGITIKEASLPKGSHRLVLSIEDTENRLGQRVLEFEVN